MRLRRVLVLAAIITLALVALSNTATGTPEAHHVGGGPNPIPTANPVFEPALARIADQQHHDDLDRWYSAVLWNETVADNAARATRAAQAKTAQAHRMTSSPKVISHHAATSESSGGGCDRSSGSKVCVASCENGGSYGRSTNGSHFGRYQFSQQSWASFGGDPSHWGSASAEEQDQVFENAWSQGRAVQESQWLRWDGC